MLPVSLSKSSRLLLQLPEGLSIRRQELGPDWCGSVGRASPCKAEGLGLQGLVPGWGRCDQCFSPSFSFLSPLSKNEINTIFFFF